MKHCQGPAICMDSQGAIYVGEITGQRVQKFAAR
jgi:hypothetical protein